MQAYWLEYTLRWNLLPGDFVPTENMRIVRTTREPNESGLPRNSRTIKEAERDR